MEGLTDALKRDSFFLMLKKEDQDVLLSAMKKRQVKKGEILSREGEAQSEMFIVVGGRLQKRSSRKEYKTVYLGAGDVTGMLHFLMKDPSFATIEAVEDSEVWSIDSDTFHRLLQEHPSLNDSYIAFLSKTLRHQMGSLARIRDSMESIEGSQKGPKIAFFDTKPYMRAAFEKANAKPEYGFTIEWYKEKLNARNAVLAAGCKVVCIFVNDCADKETIAALVENGVELIAIRAAGTDAVDLNAAREANISVTNVPAYSPHAVAEFAIGLMLTLNRKIHKAYARVRDHNFSLNGLTGFDLHGKTVGVLGTGKIGRIVAEAMMFGFGCRVIAFDVFIDEELRKKGVAYVSKEQLLAESDIISLHAPLLPSTYHTINAEALKLVKPGVMLINTSRGGLVDSRALLEALANGRVGAAGLDVLEEEKPYFFENKSESEVKDDVVDRLIAHRNVIITSHQAFLTVEALDSIANTTLFSVKEYSEGKRGPALKYNVIPVPKK